MRLTRRLEEATRKWKKIKMSTVAFFRDTVAECRVQVISCPPASWCSAFLSYIKAGKNPNKLLEGTDKRRERERESGGAWCTCPWLHWYCMCGGGLQRDGGSDRWCRFRVLCWVLQLVSALKERGWILLHPSWYPPVIIDLVILNKWNF